LLRSWKHRPADALPLSYRSSMLRAGFEPATFVVMGDNRRCSGPQQRDVAVVARGRDAESNRFDGPRKRPPFAR
jgi:hypothetical protein